MARKSRLRRRPRKQRAPLGAPPGYIDETVVSGGSAAIRVMAYNLPELVSKDGDDIDVLEGVEIPKGGTIWTDVVGGDLEVLQGLAERFGIHPLVIEDVASLHQRPKLEVYEGFVYLVLRRLTRESDGLVSDQISLIFWPGGVLTFQERESAAFDPVRKRLHAGRGRIRSHGSDYLAYALVDVLVDHVFPIMDSLQISLDTIEDAILRREGSMEPAVELSQIKRELIEIDQGTRPLREALRGVLMGDGEVFSIEVLPFLRDCHDHLGQLKDTIESIREQSTSLVNLHLAMAGQELNEVMRVLTIISTVFIPLSFIVGLYGMNFDTKSPYNMPELSFDYGYPVVVMTMLAVVGGMLFYFWKRGWFRR